MTRLESSSLRVGLLGEVRAWFGEREVDLGPPRRRALFAMLALRPGEAVSRAELVDGLWGDDPPAKAVGVVHTYVSGLRRAIEQAAAGAVAGASVLTSAGAGYLLRARHGDIDDREFTRLCDSARNLWATGDLAAAVTALNTALALRRGPALAGLTGPYLDLHRARLDEAVLSARERRAELQLLLGRDAEVISGMTGLVAEYPLREGARALLMTALYRSGRPDAATELYREAERGLGADLGLEPTAALRRIQEKIGKGEPVVPGDLRAGSAAGGKNARDALPSPETPRPAPPAGYAGRRREQELFRSMLAGLSHGRGGCAWVEGEPGSGRTALVAAGLADADTDGRVTVWLTGDDLVPGDTGEPDPPRFAEVDRLVARISRLCAESALVVVIDDVDEAGRAGWLAWGQLARLTVRLPLMLVGCARTATPGSELARVRNGVSAVGGRILELGPLSEEEVLQLVAARVGARPGPALAGLAGVAAGNPRDVHELLDAVEEAGVLRTEGGVSDLEPGGETRLAGVVVRLAERRLAGVSPETRAFLRTVALFADAVEPADLSTVADRPPSELVGVVAEATAAGILVEVGDGLAFRDTSLREVVRGEIPLPERNIRHGQAASALARSGAPVLLVARQLLELTTGFDEWVPRWLLANADAVAAQDPVAAVDLLERAVTGVRVAGSLRDGLQVLRVRWLFRIGRHPIDDAREALREAVDPAAVAALSWILAHLIYRTGDVAGAIGILLGIEESGSAPQLWRVRCRGLRAEFERRGLDDLGRAEATARSALAGATALSDRSEMAHSRHELWYAESVRRNHLAALEHIDLALTEVAPVGYMARFTLNLLDNRVLTLQNLNRLPEAGETLARMREIAERLRPEPGRVRVAAASHLYWLGRWDEALAELALVSSDQFVAGPEELRLVAPLLEHGTAALIAARRGEWERVRQRLRRGDELPLRTRSHQENSALLIAARGFEAAHRTGPAAGAAMMDPLLDFGYGHQTLRFLWMPALMRWAQAADDPGRVRAALEVCEFEAGKEIPAARAATARSWCIAMAGHDADTLLEIARHLGEVGRSVEMAEALADAAVVLADRGKPAEARRTADDALAIFGGLRATADADQLRARLARHGVSRADAADGRPNLVGWPLLSEDERAVARLVGAGKSNPEVAVELALARREVQLHLSRSLEKLGLGSREELAGKVGGEGR